MKVLLFVLLFFAIRAYANTPDPSLHDRRGAVPSYANGTGENWHDIQIHSTVEIDRKLLHYVQFNVTQKRIQRMLLPKVTTQHMCEFRRAFNGSIGDYKPKSIAEVLAISYPGWSKFLNFIENGQDYNDNPVVKKYDFARLESHVVPEAINHLADLCARRETVLTFMITGSSLCRWKPENWHKPENFPFEIPAQTATGYFHARLMCVK